MHADSYVTVGLTIYCHLTTLVPEMPLGATKIINGIAKGIGL